MDSPSSSSSLLFYLAVGRLLRGSDGQFKEGQHAIIASCAVKDDESVKSYRTHVSAIMNKGANKLQPGKRIRLTPDQQQYDLHVLPDLIGGDELKTLVFFAVTDPDFDKHQSITNLFRDFKSAVFERFSPNELDSAKASGSVHKASQEIFEKILRDYNNSKLRSVQGKVDEVKDLMKNNVKKALDNMENLEDMEVKSEQFEESARQFQKGATDVKRLMRWRYIKISIALAVVICTVLAVVIYFAVEKTK